MFPHPDLDSFLAHLDQIPWLKHLGQSSPRDAEVDRLRYWNAWPGPEDEAWSNLAFLSGKCHEDLLAVAGERRVEAENLFKRVQSAVTEMAKTRVAFDEREDAWHGPSMCVRCVALWAGVISLYLLLEQPIPAELQNVWSWIEAGHWPWGFGDRLKVY